MATTSTRSSRNEGRTLLGVPPLRRGLATLALIAAFGAAQGAECPGDAAAPALAAARETVRSLYGTPGFVEARNDIDPATIGDLEPFLTARLLGALRDFSAALRTADESTDPLTKSPYPTGPIFLSNYEGMDAFTVAGASAGPDDTVHVTVEMTFASPFGDADWTDVAVLRCDAGAWKLDDVVFDPAQTAGPSLGERIAVR